ncbi:hypothetical protein [Methanococcoides alaskense]|uniref:Uncharacterized protein n=1 Tax=Methanococcoides alaskense TaxID=325778 RepID=A0AA90U0N2_9EURY|nr:hypothetical protein [Methanococcoides alaskense]MDR6223665.1 hypothetical protein [Methanococcoides alaskense]
MWIIYKFRLPQAPYLRCVSNDNYDLCFRLEDFLSLRRAFTHVFEGTV